MKSFAVILAVAAAAAVASAAPCELPKLTPLLTDEDVKQCTADTGFQPPIPPSADMMPKVCKSTACTKALGKLKALGLGDCTVGTTSLETGLIGPIEKACGGGAAAGGATTTAPAAGNSTATTTAPPAGNSTSTTKPSNTTTTAPTTATTSAPVASTTNVPAATTTAPTPAPSSAAFAPSQASSVLLGSSLVAVVYMAAN